MDDYITRKAAIKKRHSCNRDCSVCDFATEGDSWCDGEIFVVDLLRVPAADVVAKKDFNDCRNELCLRCGSYRESHLGACDGCRWQAEKWR